MQLSLKRDQLDGLDLYTYDHSVRDDVIRKNPTDGVMKEISKQSGKSRGIRHALTI